MTESQRSDILRRYPIVLLLIAVLIGTFALIGPASPAAQEPAKTPPAPELIRWDYKVVSLLEELMEHREDLQDRRRSYAGIERSLDRLGRDGWQLVHASDDLFIFARPVIPEPR